ncbi:hypothetical protein EON79_12720 [bacterium]|nr:MAG: hypothetical protein EON79_12720 [bacterium]
MSPFGAPPDMVEYSLDQLSTFHRIGAYVMGVFSLCGLPHTIFGLVALINPGIFGAGKGTPPPPFFGLIFLTVGGGLVCSMLGIAYANLAASSWVREKRRLSSVQVVAALSCLFMPLGTLLGIYSLVTLSRPEVGTRFKS